ncbi:MAG: hypothetical protein PHE21_03390 [Candidatus Dojkabacteria bacterium]|nr:hypothetical protein [Candidatus Dojkabacteria bacterium]
MINVLYIIIGIFILAVLEGFFVSFVGLKLLLFIILFLQGKVNWKWIAGFLVPYSLISDVISNYPLGTNLLLIGIPLGILILFSLLINVQEGLVSYVVKFFCFLIYFILINILPTLLIDGVFGILSWSILGASILKAAFSALLLYVSNILGERLRGEKSGNNLTIRKKWN